ncbi:proline-rich receptor-like protein kinase PERK15 [Tripterygium wilfordii]|uniref:proline-rich receptor-like protein kinase PERK15 n=1 Tax=Tripterygium wilfordii TaxID=458696 RepID=UPI0018F7F68A|nr:proline-rich receptor-like protein kinase PERK15 [Tripterygium wilfordii]
MTGLIVGVVLGAIFVMVGLGIFVIIRRRRTREMGEGLPGGRAQKPTAPTIALGVPQMKAFTYEELAEAANGFSVSNLLGQGGFGDVYKGILEGTMEVAIKKLKPGSRQGEHEFQQEVKIISRVHHRHLVSLVGYCIADAHRMLVYEFVSNKTLEFHLHGKERAAMDWATRVKIAVGAAKGLAYLHEGCHPTIIHRDVKGTNILLDDNFEAKVADFGLAKTFLDIETHVSTAVKGTFGYIDPEYASAWKLTDKSDVYSFGVVLLELITGHRPIDKNKLFLDDGIVDWASPLLDQALKDGIYDNLVDPKLHKCYNYTEMARMIACAAASIRHSAKRPRMSQIVGALEGNISPNDLIEGITPGQSTIFVSCVSSDQYKEDSKNFRKMELESQELGSSGYRGPTSEYGLKASSSSTEGQQTSYPRNGVEGNGVTD